MEDLFGFYGVYKITNMVTGDFYVGSTISSFKSRFAQCKSMYKSYKFGGRKATPLLFEGFDKFGYENFKFEILYHFQVNAPKIKKLSVVRALEERCIKKLSPRLNFCKSVLDGGRPNSGVKLTEEWKNNLKRSVEGYKHSSLTLAKVKLKNKENGCVYTVHMLDGSVFEGNLVDVSLMCGYSKDRLRLVSKGLISLSRVVSVVKHKTQTKRIMLHTDRGDISFESFNKCDLFLNMWRGFTSFNVTRGRTTLKGFRYTVF